MPEAIFWKRYFFLVHEAVADLERNAAQTQSLVQTQTQAQAQIQPFQTPAQTQTQTQGPASGPAAAPHTAISDDEVSKISAALQAELNTTVAGSEAVEGAGAGAGSGPEAGIGAGAGPGVGLDVDIDEASLIEELEKELAQ